MKEIRREADLKSRILRITFEDVFGNEHVGHIPMQSESCPSCLTPFVKDASGVVDAEAIIQKIIDDQEPHTEKAIKSFEKAGIDMTAIRKKK